MTDPLERLTNLAALLLRTRQPLTLERIAAEMTGQYPTGATARRAMFERDKRELRAAGLVIDTVVLSGSEAGATAYRIDPAGYELPDLGLTDTEARALNLAVAAVHVDRGAGSASALAKLGGAAGDVADPDEGAPMASLPGAAALPALFEAHTARASVTFRYRGAQAVRERTVDPYALIGQRGVWYLIGRDHGRDEVRTFRVDRVEAHEPTVGPAGTFEVPEGFDAAAVLPDDARRLGADAVEARVRVDAPRATLVVHELGEAAVVAREADGAVVVRVPATNELAFRAWMIELGEHAEVLEPAAVRSALVEWLALVAAAR